MFLASSKGLEVLCVKLREELGCCEDDVNQLKGQLSQMAKDLMVFAGLVRYKLPSRVYDLLTRAGGDVGGY